MNTILFFGDESERMRLRGALSDTEYDIVPVNDLSELSNVIKQRTVDAAVLHQRATDIDFDRLLGFQADGIRLSLIWAADEQDYDGYREYAEQNGIYIVPTELFLTDASVIFSLLRSADSALSRLNRENEKLSHKIVETRLVDRAKCVLIQQLKLTEEQAHKYIEKQAMDLRMSREKVARVILQTYER